jgi:succinate dehydrogenase / fumarate reductase membrane anchor subunit
MRETKYWTWHMAAGVVILFLLGLHMLIMHLGGLTHLFVQNPVQPAISKANSLARDGNLFFTVTYVLLLGAALYHGLYGLRTILFELTLKPAVEKAVSAFLLILGLGLFGLGAWAAIVVHAAAVRG